MHGVGYSARYGIITLFLIGQLTHPTILDADWSKITMQNSQGHTCKPLHPYKLTTIKFNIHTYSVIV